jgi:hypothetical protein
MMHATPRSAEVQRTASSPHAVFAGVMVEN